MAVLACRQHTMPVKPIFNRLLVQMMGETALGLCDIAVVEPSWAHPGTPRAQLGRGAVPETDELNESDS